MASYVCIACGFRLSCSVLTAKNQAVCACPQCGVTNALTEDEQSGKAPYHVRVPLENDRWFTVSQCESVRNACEIATVLLNANNVNMTRVLLEYLP